VLAPQEQAWDLPMDVPHFRAIRARPRAIAEF
jgi:hypothetical protein